MRININKEKFSDIENAFVRLKSNESEISALREISDALKSITGKTITVNTIRPESKNQECFVMSVYPEESTLDTIIAAIVEEKNDSVIAKIWNDTSAWNIEIDTRILSRDIDMDEKELTALLLHEVGHIIYSNTVPARISKIIRFKFAKTGMGTKYLLKDNFLRKFINFPILNACNTSRSKASLKNELKADKYSINSGYGESLASAMDKIIMYAGTDETSEEEMDDLMGFSIDSLLAIQRRQNDTVRRNITKMITSTPSRFAKNVINKISIGLNGDPNSSVTESVKDNYLYNKIDKLTEEFYASEAFFNRIHKLKRIDPADLDYIYLELNNIKSNDDRMMVVSYIYSKLDIIDYYIALIDSKNPKYVVPHSREALTEMRERLDKYRIEAINRKLPEINYGINIQYPSGYEG